MSKLLFLIFISLYLPTQAQGAPEVTIYYNAACVDCTYYINQKLIPLLRELGVGEIIWKDYINERENRLELVERSKKLGIPPNLQGHFTVFIDEKIILQGHVPLHVIRDLFTAEFERIVVYQDLMGEAASSYKVWAFRGPIKEYPIDTPIGEYLSWLAAQEDLEPPEFWDVRRFLPLIITSGLLDGVNPCAFAVLLFFIAFLFTIHRAKVDIVRVGMVYITMIYLTYLGIGLGILQTIVLVGTPHLMAKLGSWLLILLGLVNVKDYFWYGRWISLSPGGRLHQASIDWLKRATLPATAVGGFLVGLCTFPCSGGIYVAVLGLLSAKTTYWLGLGYLLLYNLMFVMPLVVILLGVSNRRAAGRLARWEASNKRAVKLTTGAVMISLGAIILIWFA
jgi:cytochrome c biogenesis protein CcdA